MGEHGAVYGDYAIGYAKVLTQAPCPLGLPVIVLLTGAHVGVA